ncbi:MAG: beta-N-acetylhexosaminidase, partial [Gammaproteobacteria bacterium]
MFRVSRNTSTAPMVACLLVGACVSDQDSERPAPPSVIPAVAVVELGTGTFPVGAGIRMHVPSDPEVERIAQYFADLVARTRGIQLGIAREDATPPAGAIAFVIDTRPSGASAESYELAISSERIVISARAPRGLFYGAMTLWQLLTATDATGRAVTLHGMTIRDEPRFAWRGFMLDVARHYMPPERVKQMIDWMALHKLNTLHWHLTDDQGWRLEIRKYPRLTEVGAWRVPAGAAGTAGRYGGYYTQDEVRDIVRYAAERFVTVVPEIGMPGHAQAAIASYPHLGTEGPPPPVSPDWGVHNHLYDVEENTFAFLEDVLSEVFELFPSAYIHVGGDEAVKDRWIASPRVQQRMRQLAIPNETALQSYFTARVESFIRRNGRKLIGWDEILEGGRLPPAATVMSWRGTAGAIEAARQGHDVVMAQERILYLDYLQSDSRDEPPGRPRYVTLADVYAYEPLPAELAAAEAAHILGAQLNAWTEHMRTPERVHHNAFPKVAALAEVLWSPRGQRDWQSFVHRLAPQFARYARLGIDYADSAFAPRFAVLSNQGADSIRVELSTQTAAGEIRYTLDGREPTRESPLYREPLELRIPASVRAVTYLDGFRMSAAQARAFDRQSLGRRSDDELQTCAQKLVLRLEDDAPLEGERAVFNIDIMDPCWIFKDADLSGISRISAAVGQLPFNFQIGEDARKIPLRTPESPQGEL